MSRVSQPAETVAGDLPGVSFTRRAVAGDTHPRLTCDACGFVRYENPKIVVGAVCCWEDRVLLCRRDIEPRRGHWTIPAGYLELGETTEQGAAREVREEARADVTVGPLLGVYCIPRISQVLMIYRAAMRSADCEAGDETSEVRLARASDIPWDDLAFPSVRWALTHHAEAPTDSPFPPFAAPPQQAGPLPATGQPLPSGG